MENTNLRFIHLRIPFFDAQAKKVKCSGTQSRTTFPIRPRQHNPNVRSFTTPLEPVAIFSGARSFFCEKLNYCRRVLIYFYWMSGSWEYSHICIIWTLSDLWQNHVGLIGFDLGRQILSCVRKQRFWRLFSTPSTVESRDQSDSVPIVREWTCYHQVKHWFRIFRQISLSNTSRINLKTSTVEIFLLFSRLQISKEFSAEFMIIQQNFWGPLYETTSSFLSSLVLESLTSQIS